MEKKDTRIWRIIIWVVTMIIISRWDYNDGVWEERFFIQRNQVKNVNSDQVGSTNEKKGCQSDDQVELLGLIVEN